jgi:hypothetical protein
VYQGAPNDRPDGRRQHFFCEVDSDDPEQSEFINDGKELYQIVHHTVTHEKDSCLHAIGTPNHRCSARRWILFWS